MKSNYEITVHGKVQGVGFRYFAQKKAAEFNITGYVRNMPGRVVLIVAEGENTDMETFVDHMRMGPTMARVNQVSVSKSPYTGSFSAFEVRY
jgi:acylphosphatase